MLTQGWPERTDNTLPKEAIDFLNTVVRTVLASLCYRFDLHCPPGAVDLLPFMARCRKSLLATLVVGHFLDPRTKGLAFEPDAGASPPFNMTKSAAKQCVVDFLKELDDRFGLVVTSSSVGTLELDQVVEKFFPQEERDRYAILGAKFVEAQLSAARAQAQKQLASSKAPLPLEAELDEYISVGVVPSNTLLSVADRHQFVTSLAGSFPRISRGIRYLSTIQPSSSEAERTFSESELVVSRLRTRLAPHTTEALVLLNRNTREGAVCHAYVAKWAESLNSTPPNEM